MKHFKNFDSISEINDFSKLNIDLCYVIKLDPIVKIHPEIDFHKNLKKNGVIYVGKGSRKTVPSKHRFVCHLRDKRTKLSSLRRNLSAVFMEEKSFIPELIQFKDGKKRYDIDEDGNKELTRFIKEDCKVKFYKRENKEGLDKLETRLIKKYQPTLNRQKIEKVCNDKVDKIFVEKRNIEMPEFRDELWNIYFDKMNDLYDDFTKKASKLKKISKKT
tara:strand:+ start:124 stop:774 length:651 start_codon:yes stop_codon:yes gene_type:complete